MPAPIVPPSASDVGAIMFPRQLQRWLDTNRTTRLERTNTYVKLPAFTQANNTWNGYSDIVQTFNVESPNNMSFIGIEEELLTNANYVLCVSYQVNGAVTRYMLWDAEGSNLNQQIPLYTGQPLLKNFRFEIWNTSQGICSQSSDITFYTSVLGKFDYRYASNSALVAADSPCTTFNATANSVPTITNNATNVLEMQLRSSYGVTVGVSWASEYGGFNFTSASLSRQQSYINGTFLNLIGSGFASIEATPVTTTANAIYFLFQFNVSTSGDYDEIIVDFENGFQLTTATLSGVRYLSINGHTLNYHPVDGEVYLVNVDNIAGFGQVAALININTQEVLDFITLGGSYGTSTYVRILGANSLCRAIELSTYFSTDYDGRQQALSYFYGTYAGNFTVPLTFPANSVSANN